MSARCRDDDPIHTRTQRNATQRNSTYTRTRVHAYARTRVHAYTHTTRIHAYTHTRIHAYTQRRPVEATKRDTPAVGRKMPAPVSQTGIVDVATTSASPSTRSAPMEFAWERDAVPPGQARGGIICRCPRNRAPLPNLGRQNFKKTRNSKRLSDAKSQPTNLVRFVPAIDLLILLVLVRTYCRTKLNFKKGPSKLPNDGPASGWVRSGL